jgi:hypothetical protein
MEKLADCSLFTIICLQTMVYCLILSWTIISMCQPKEFSCL